MTIVNVDELLAYMGGLRVTNEQRDIIESAILPGVQQELEDFLNRPVEPVYVRENIEPDDRGWLFFSITPVWQVISVKRSDGQSQEITGPVVTPLPAPPSGVTRTWDTMTRQSTLYKYQVNTFSHHTAWSLFTGAAFYTVEYVAGYNGYVDKQLKLGCLRVAARDVEMQFDDSLTLRGGATEAASDSDSRAKGWTDEELLRFDRLRRRTVVT